MKLVCEHCRNIYEGVAGSAHYPYCSAACKRASTHARAAPAKIAVTGANGSPVSVPVERRHGADNRE